MLTQRNCKVCGNIMIQNSANHETCDWCKFYSKRGEKNPLTKKGFPGVIKKC